MTRRPRLPWLWLPVLLPMAVVLAVWCVLSVALETWWAWVTGVDQEEPEDHGDHGWRDAQ